MKFRFIKINFELFKFKNIKKNIYIFKAKNLFFLIFFPTIIFIIISILLSDNYLFY